MVLSTIHTVVIHAVEVAFESVHVSGPEPAEGSQPGIDFLKWFGFQPVETALGVHRGFHETGLAQHAQVLGHGRLRHTKLALDLSHRLLGRDQEAQYRAAVRLRNDFEDRFHSAYILHMAYTCQGIYIEKVPGTGFSRRVDAPSGALLAGAIQSATNLFSIFCTKCAGQKLQNLLLNGLNVDLWRQKYTFSPPRRLTTSIPVVYNFSNRGWLGNLERRTKNSGA